MYIEYVFLENLILNYFIIFLTAKLVNQKAKFVLFSSFLGSLISLLCPLFNIGLFAGILIKILTLILLVNLSLKLGPLKQTLSIYAVFVMITFVFGGCIALLKQMLEELSYLIILAGAFGVFVMLKMLFSFLNKKRVVDSFKRKVKIFDGEKVIDECGYFDSGNVLYDPVSNSPISLVSPEVFSKLYGQNLLSIFLNKIDTSKLKCGHYINVNSATRGGKIFVFMVDKMVVYGSEQEEIKNAYLGLSISGFSKSLSSSVLIHASL